MEGDSLLSIVRGDFMDRKELQDGDLTVAHATADACNGKTVVARLDNEVTLKRLVRPHAHEVELRPERHNHVHCVKRINLVRTVLDIDGLVVGALLGRMFECECCASEASP